MKYLKGKQREDEGELLSVAVRKMTRTNSLKLHQRKFKLEISKNLYPIRQAKNSPS